MNTNFIASLLLPALTATLCAQELKLEPALATRTLSATVDGAAEGSFVVLVVGLQEAAIKLPGGNLLGVSPDMIVGYAIAGDGPTTLYTRLAAEMDDFRFFAQAVALHPRIPMEEKGGITLSSVHSLASSSQPSGRPGSEG